MTPLKTARFASFAAICLVFLGCSNSRHIASSNAARHPKFINDITLTPSCNSGIQTEIPYSHIKKDEKKTAAKNGNSPANNIKLPEPICEKYAHLLGISSKNISSAAPLYNFIEEWYGVPYVFGGNDKTGIDCSAFVQRLYENVFGINVVRTAFEQFNDCKLLKDTEKLMEGDLVFFYTVTRSRKSRRTRRHISHVGIYLANSYFIHASSGSGVMISSLKDDYWARKFAGAGYIPKS